MSEAIAQKLDEARALIEKGWTKEYLAKTAKGRSCQPISPKAVCWCSIGAIHRATRNDCYSLTLIAIEAVEEALDHEEELEVWNDAPERTQAEVIEAFRKAADLARSEAAAVGGR